MFVIRYTALFLLYALKYLCILLLDKVYVYKREDAAQIALLDHFASASVIINTKNNTIFMTKMFTKAVSIAK